MPSPARIRKVEEGAAYAAKPNLSITGTPLDRRSRNNWMAQPCQVLIYLRSHIPGAGGLTVPGGHVELALAPEMMTPLLSSTDCSASAVNETERR